MVEQEKILTQMKLVNMMILEDKKEKNPDFTEVDPEVNRKLNQIRSIEAA